MTILIVGAPLANRYSHHHCHTVAEHSRFVQHIFPTYFVFSLVILRDVYITVVFYYLTNPTVLYAFKSSKYIFVKLLILCRYPNKNNYRYASIREGRIK